MDADLWRQWVLPYDFAAGRHTVTVRATSADGEVQTDARADPFPAGASGWHTIAGGRRMTAGSATQTRPGTAGTDIRTAPAAGATPRDNAVARTGQGAPTT